VVKEGLGWKSAFSDAAKIASARFAGLAGALKKRYIGENL